MNISRREWIVLWGISVLICLMSSIPYIVGYASQTDDLIFNGTVYNRFDYSGYMASFEPSGGITILQRSDG